MGIDSLVQKLTDAGQGDGCKAPGGVRSYQEVAALVGCTLTPCAQAKVLAVGSWVVHTTFAWNHHCFAIAIEAAGTVQFYNAGACYKINREELNRYLEQ